MAETIKLGDVATYVNGYAFKPEDRGEVGLPIIRIQDLTGNSYDLGFYDGEYPEKIEINDGDVLISWSASLGVYVWNRGKALLNQHIFKVEFDKAEIDKSYFVYAVRRKLDEMSTKTHGATMKHIVKKDFDATVIPYPPKDKQAEIANNLDRVSRIIAARNEELTKLDDLIKARFVELYNSSSLGEETTLEAITERVKVGFVGTCEKYYTDASGIPMLRTGNITDNGIDLADLKYVTQEFHEKNKKSQIHEGDLLIARHGSNGQANVYYGPEAQCLNAVVIVPNYEITTSVFLAGLINSPVVKEQIERTLVGSTQHVVNTKSIASLVVRIPDLTVQKGYETFVKQVDKSKVAVQKALNETQQLFDSLMQEFFG